jgi:hypothetical protein
MCILKNVFPDAKFEIQNVKGMGHTVESLVAVLGSKKDRNL